MQNKSYVYFSPKPKEENINKHFHDIKHENLIILTVMKERKIKKRWGTITAIF